MPNTFAYLMIAVWPLVTLILWSRLDRAQALIWTILAGYLYLPPLTAFNLPAVPDFDKTSVPSLAALAMAVLDSGLVFRGRGFPAILHAEFARAVSCVMCRFNNPTADFRNARRSGSSVREGH